MRAAAALLAGLATLCAQAAEFRSLGERAAVLYDAPSLKADRIFVASRGYPFEVLVKLDQWTKVRDSGGEVAWIENKSLGERRTALVTVPVADARVGGRFRGLQAGSARGGRAACQRMGEGAPPRRAGRLRPRGPSLGRLRRQ